MKNVKVVPGLLQHALVVMDVVSRDMGNKLKEKFVPKRRTWLLRKEEHRIDFEEKVKGRWMSGGDDGDTGGQIWE